MQDLVPLALPQLFPVPRRAVEVRPLEEGALLRRKVQRGPDRGRFRQGRDVRLVREVELGEIRAGGEERGREEMEHEVEDHEAVVVIVVC